MEGVLLRAIQDATRDKCFVCFETDHNGDDVLILRGMRGGIGTITYTNIDDNVLAGVVKRMHENMCPPKPKTNIVKFKEIQNG